MEYKIKLKLLKQKIFKAKKSLKRRKVEKAKLYKN